MLTEREKRCLEVLRTARDEAIGIYMKTHGELLPQMREHYGRLRDLVSDLESGRL